MNKKQIYFKFLMIMCILIISITSYGCLTRYEFNISTIIYVDSMGIKYNEEDNNYSLYFHTSSPLSLTTSEMGGSNSTITYNIGKVDSESISNGIRLINKSINKNILLTHIKSVIFHTSFINYDNLKYFCDFVKTYKFMTTDFCIFATSDKIDDIYKVTNVENNNPYYSIITDNNEVVPYKLIRYINLLNELYEKYLVIKMHYISVDDTIWKNNDSKITSVLVTGECYVNENGMLLLNLKEYRFLSIMINEYSSSLIFDNDSYVLMNMKLKFAPNKIKIKADVYPSNVYNKKNTEQVEKLENYIYDEFQKLYTKAKEENFDIFEFQDYYYRRNKLKDDFHLETISFDKNNFDFNFKILN